MLIRNFYKNEDALEEQLWKKLYAHYGSKDKKFDYGFLKQNLITLNDYNKPIDINFTLIENKNDNSRIVLKPVNYERQYYKNKISFFNGKEDSKISNIFKSVVDFNKIKTNYKFWKTAAEFEKWRDKTIYQFFQAITTIDEEYLKNKKQEDIIRIKEEYDNPFKDVSFSVNSSLIIAPVYRSIAASLNQSSQKDDEGDEEHNERIHIKKDKYELIPDTEKSKSKFIPKNLNLPPPDLLYEIYQEHNNIVLIIHNKELLESLISLEDLHKLVWKKHHQNSVILKHNAKQIYPVVKNKKSF